jgi:hypothetical protein
METGNLFVFLFKLTLEIIEVSNNLLIKLAVILHRFLNFVDEFYFFLDVDFGPLLGL